jgi:hypothetical protein
VGVRKTAEPKTMLAHTLNILISNIAYIRSARQAEVMGQQSCRIPAERRSVQFPLYLLQLADQPRALIINRRFTLHNALFIVAVAFIT